MVLVVVRRCRDTCFADKCATTNQFLGRKAVRSKRMLENISFRIQTSSYSFRLSFVASSSHGFAFERIEFQAHTESTNEIRFSNIIMGQHL